eukprot:gb/GEZJ01001624.1/.p3 GENE.gb/GEZJ01001624.1/~~gb/GEZJ01001624.1/.p3  ORF type:complete len:166 (-),score=17.68 gb/GEZJ01001624.1/:3681-4178(-)
MYLPSQTVTSHIPFVKRFIWTRDQMSSLSIVVSSHGLLVLCDFGGFLHQWSSSESVMVSSSSEPVWTTPINPEAPTPSMPMNDFINSDIGATIPKCAIPELKCKYLTEELFDLILSQSQRRKRGKLYTARMSKGVDTTPDRYPSRPLARFPLQISGEVLDGAQQN